MMNNITIQNNICVKGKLTTCDIRMLENFIPPYNATVVDKLASAGNISGENLELSSDYDGSMRRNAAERGLVALKPTCGSVSRYGLITGAPSLEVIIPIGKTVDDVAALYRIIREEDICGTAAVECETPNICDNIELPSAEYAQTAHSIIACAERFSNLARFDGIKFGHRSENSATLAELYENSRGEGFDDIIKKQIIAGAIFLSREYRHLYYDRAVRARAKITAEVSAALEQCDVISAPLNGEWAVIPNLTGLPALTVGNAQLIGKKFSEELLFRVANTL